NHQLEHGLLKITLEYAARDPGQGGLRMEFFGVDSNLDDQPRAAAYSGISGHRGLAEITYAISPAEAGEYLLKVSDAGDVLSAGVSYRLAADLQPFEAQNYCSAARELLMQRPLQGDLSGANHTWPSGSCAALEEPTP